MPKFKVTLLPTVKVKYKEGGAIAIINESDFDPEIHTKVVERPKVVKAAADETPLPTEAELKTMTVAVLKDSAEYKALADTTNLTTKEQIVQAILANRSAQD